MSNYLLDEETYEDEKHICSHCGNPVECDNTHCDDYQCRSCISCSLKSKFRIDKKMTFDEFCDIYHMRFNKCQDVPDDLEDFKMLVFRSVLSDE